MKELLRELIITACFSILESLISKKNRAIIDKNIKKNVEKKYVKCKENIEQYNIYFDEAKHRQIIDKLKNQRSAHGYIAYLIREDIKKNGNY